MCWFVPFIYVGLYYQSMKAPDEIPVNLPSGAFVETTSLKKIPFKAALIGIFKGHMISLSDVS